MVFPNPEFLKDRNCGQYLFFAKFVTMLNRNYVALSIQAHEQMLDFVSDACQAYYHCSKSRDIGKEIIGDLKTQLQELTGEAA